MNTFLQKLLKLKYFFLTGTFKVDNLFTLSTSKNVDIYVPILTSRNTVTLEEMLF